MTTPDSHLTDSTRVAFRAVRDVLATAREAAGEARVATAKGERDLVTATDVAVEDALREVAARELGIAVVGEERGGTAPAGEPYWLLDPLCGTSNFAHGIPLYCVNLAVVLDDEVVAAVVGDASTGEVLVAERGRGAWGIRGDERRRLTATTASSTVVVESGLVTGAPREEAALMTAAVLRTGRWDLMSLRSTLSLAYVAAGRVAAYALFVNAPLHLAAGTLVASEAGALVTDLDGEPWTFGSASLLASGDEALHRDLLALRERVG